MAGRPRKPDELKAQKGTLQPSRRLEPSVKLAKLESFELPPADLPEAGRAEWSRVMQQLQPLGVLTAVDLSLLKSYCRHIATMELAATKLDEPGGYTTTMQNKGGGSYEIKSPWVAIYNEASDRASKLGQQFGFTPSSRTRIVAPKQQPEADPWAELD
ncbi:P27 family predicted phage terminase small subunit [Hymenobacter sp. UYAg731]